MNKLLRVKATTSPFLGIIKYSQNKRPTHILLLDHFLADSHHNSQQKLGDSSNELPENGPEVKAESTELTERLAQSKLGNSLLPLFDGFEMPTMAIPKKNTVETIN
jgi:hypothetical protein